MSLAVDVSWVRVPRTAGWSVLRAAVAHLGALELRRRCGACGSDTHGGPVVLGRPDVGLSLSYSAGLVVAAVARGAAVGLDVESEAADVDGIGAVLLSPRDHPQISPTALRRTWVRKEAVLKALGVGLSRDPATLAVSAPHESPAVIWWSGEAPPVTLIDLDERHGVPPGQVASLAVVGPEPPTVSVRVVDI